MAFCLADCLSKDSGSLDDCVNEFPLPLLLSRLLACPVGRATFWPRSICSKTAMREESAWIFSASGTDWVASTGGR